VDVAPENTVPADDYSAVDDMVSAELGAQFRIGRPLKHGHGTHVYFAHDASGGGGREAALKVIVLPAGVGPADAARFEEAARTAAGLDHPNIARPYRFGTTDTLWWYAMDYVPAPSVAERLAAALGRPLDVPLTWRIALQIASALDYAHRRGIVHGALKPADVLLDDAGWVRVVDTGLAQAMRPVGPRVDLYSLALIVHECLTGSPPRAGAAQATKGGLPPGVEPHAAQVLQRALAQAPGHRFVGVLDFVGALTGGAPQPSGLAPRSPPTGARRPLLLFDPEEPPPPRRRFYRLGVALALTASVGVLWVAAQSGQVPRVPSSYGAPPVRTPAPVTAAVSPAPNPPPAQPRPQPSVPVTPQAQPRRVVPVARPPEPGFLSVSARPWALLSIDGRLIGNTPKVKVRLPPGVHQLRLQRVGFKTYEAAVAVKPGETVSITNITLTATSP
jgi:serine/threonine-protein kinase